MKCCKCGIHFHPGFDKTSEIANPGCTYSERLICEECATSKKVKEVNPLFRAMQKLLDEKLKEWEVYQTAINQVIGGVLFE